MSQEGLVPVRFVPGNSKRRFQYEQDVYAEAGDVIEVTEYRANKLINEEEFELALEGEE